MAEFIFKKHVNLEGLDKDFFVYSRATSTEEIGNDIDFRAKSVLRANKIEYTPHSATQFSKSDYDKADYIFAMDGYNFDNLKRMTFGDKENKIALLSNKEIDDPWYTGEFQKAFDEINIACQKRFEEIKSKLKTK